MQRTALRAAAEPVRYAYGATLLDTASGKKD
jgi:hypothetical protein